MAPAFRVRRRHIAGLATAALFTWIAVDLYAPRREDFRDFDPVTMGRIEGEMWRSYYERRPARLFWQLANSHRLQYHMGPWRSLATAYRAAKSAFIFKDGKSREEYGKALPDLEQYFATVSALSLTPFDAHRAAQDELEWWIIRREPKRFTTVDWERLVAAVAGEIYQLPAERFAEYSKLRVEAMVLRDKRGAAITEEDWAQVQRLLERSWNALAMALR
ncbi:MAG: hypothetical protein ABI877_08260 [Gemmatimonadaceae bacterium]